MVRPMRAIIALLALALVSAAPPRPTPEAGERLLVVAFGDSLTAGYGLDPGLGLAPQLEATLRRRGHVADVEDAGVSGDTTTAGRARLGWTLDGLPRKPDLVIVELGGNDMLRLLPTSLIEENLAAIVEELKRRDIKVLLAGMRAVRNADPAYVRAFEAIYPRLARRHDVPLYPFFLDGAALVPGRMLDDGVHPSFEGVKQMAVRIAPAVEDAVAR